MCVCAYARIKIHCCRESTGQILFPDLPSAVQIPGVLRYPGHNDDVM